MLGSMSFETIDPAIANTIAKLLFLPVKNMLQKIKWDMLI
jgi:hypothetical protein